MRYIGIDHDPFGMLLVGRNWSENYRYGFQHQEMDSEIWGGSITFEYRITDVRIGRFLSVDPITKNFPSLCPYQFADNQVIHSIEYEGLENPNNLNANGFQIRGPYTYSQLNEMFGAWGDAFLTHPDWKGVTSASQVWFIHQTADGVWRRELVLAGDPMEPIFEVIQISGRKGDDPGYTNVAFQINKYVQFSVIVPFMPNSNTYAPGAPVIFMPVINILNANPELLVAIQGNTNLPPNAAPTDRSGNPWVSIDGVVIADGTATTNTLCSARGRVIQNTLVAGGINRIQISILANQYNQPSTSTIINVSDADTEHNLPVPRSTMVIDTTTVVTPL